MKQKTTDTTREPLNLIETAPDDKRMNIALQALVYAQNQYIDALMQRATIQTRATA